MVCGGRALSDWILGTRVLRDDPLLDNFYVCSYSGCLSPVSLFSRLDCLEGVEGDGKVEVEGIL